MTWDPDFGCPVHPGHPYDCDLPHPKLTDIEERALAHEIGVECGFANCETCNKGTIEDPMTSSNRWGGGHIIGSLPPTPPMPGPLAHGVCTCGHTGDGEEGQHAGKDGLGACLYRGCGCRGFVNVVVARAAKDGGGQ